MNVFANRVFTWNRILACAVALFADYASAAGSLNPQFPIVEGRYQMTHEWALVLPEKFNRRIEDGSMVFWRPGMTVWINVWGNGKSTSREDRLHRIKADVSPKAFDIEEQTTSNPWRYTYRIKEHDEQGKVAALYGFAVGESGHVQMAIYLDREADVANAYDIARSLQESVAH